MHTSSLLPSSQVFTDASTSCYVNKVEVGDTIDEVDAMMPNTLSAYER